MRLLLISSLVFLHLFAETPLHDDSYWKKLLHYQNGHSRIVSKEFFLSTQDTPALAEELNATLDALNSSDGGKTACRFPARYEWLKTKVSLPTYDLDNCEDLQKFQTGFPKDEVDILYKIGTINSAAGGFGHNYLLFKDQNSTYDASLTIDVTAKTEDKPFLIHAYRGFIGHYKATYQKTLFYQELNDAIADNQSFYLYRLNLTQHEITMLIYHLYELQNMEAKYYYLNGNCTSYLNEALSFVQESPCDSGYIDAPSELSKTYCDKISLTSSITLDDYHFKYLRGLNEEEKIRYLSARKLQGNYSTVKEIQWGEYQKPSLPNIASPSMIAAGAYSGRNADGFAMTYSYYDKSIQSRYKRFEQRSDLSLLTIGADIEHETARLTQLNLIRFNKYSLNESSSIHLSSGLNRENDDYTLHYENELGVGVPLRYNNFVTYLVLNGGLENADFYLKPKITAFYELNEDHTIGVNYYHKFAASDFYQTEVVYKRNFGYWKLQAKYLKNNGKEDNRASISLGYSF